MSRAFHCKNSINKGSPFNHTFRNHTKSLFTINGINQQYRIFHYQIHIFYTNWEWYNQLWNYNNLPKNGDVTGSKWPVVSALKASRMLFKGCVRYLASIVDTTRKVVTELADVRVVCRFPDVSLRNCQGYHQVEELSLKSSYYLEQCQYLRHPIGWLQQSWRS